ncbi:unnamed protein product [Parnassius mnemosyne]|uniref:BESS domain-containing protein n=1 Tax=Parnassius mnemosyne TaxID=213953 RepID=A0AAV1K8A8_9NEOP
MTTDTATVPNEVEEENEAAESTDSSIPPDTLNSCEALDATPTQNRTIRRRLNPPELQIASKQMSEAFNNLNKMINKQDVVEDECDIFGKLIAKKLKKIPEHEREEIMFDIHALFRRPRSFERSSVDSLRSPTPTCRNYPNVTMTSPRPHSSFSEPHNSFVPFSDGTDGRQYMLHIPETNENTFLNEKSSMVHIIRDEVVRPADKISSVTSPTTIQTRFVPYQTSSMNNIINQAYYKSE